MVWEKKRLLVWGKTYPEFSTKYYETVCTGAVDGDTGKLIRIYPITLRHMKDPLKAYDWIEAEIERNESDFRPESYRIRQDTIKVVGHLDTEKAGWAERSRWVLSAGNVFSSVKALQAAEAERHTSLGLVKPKQITRIHMEYKSESEREEWEEHRERAFAQKDLFVEADSVKKDLAFCPVRYRAKFICDDAQCTTEHDFSILDWGLYVLNYREFADGGSATAQKKVVAKIEQLMDTSKRDPYFFLGNTKAHSHSFMIVGLFHPPKAVLQKQIAIPGFD